MYSNLSYLVLLFCTVIRFVSISAKYGICTVVSLNGTLVEVKIRTWELGHLNVYILASTSVPFWPTTMQMPNFALTETKRITLCASHTSLRYLSSKDSTLFLLTFLFIRGLCLLFYAEKSFFLCLLLVMKLVVLRFTVVRWHATCSRIFPAYVKSLCQQSQKGWATNIIFDQSDQHYSKILRNTYTICIHKKLLANMYKKMSVLCNNKQSKHRYSQYPGI